jgi:hypothetical protein
MEDFRCGDGRTEDVWIFDGRMFDVLSLVEERVIGKG